MTKKIFALEERRTSRGSDCSTLSKLRLCVNFRGSSLGPLLFMLYASKLFDVVEPHLSNVHAYADDTQLYISFKPDGSATVDALQPCIRDIRTWMVQDKLLLNDATTEFLIIGTRAQLNKVTMNDLQVG